MQTLLVTQPQSFIHRDEKMPQTVLPTGRITLNSAKRSGNGITAKRAHRSNSLRLSPFNNTNPYVYQRDPYNQSQLSPNVALYQHDERISPLPSPNSISQSSSQSSTTPTFFQRLLESRAYWLALYFCFNLGLTLYNKGVLVHFPFPYTLTAVHALFGSIGSSLLARAGFFTPAKLTRFQRMVITGFSVLYAINIVVSNVSLQLVTVPFHQVVRATTPVFTIILSRMLLGTMSSRARVISLIPVIAGVGLATYGDYYYTLWGFILTLFGAVLASLKTILTNVLQSRPGVPQAKSSLVQKFDPDASASTGSPALPQLNPLAFLHLLSPLAFLQCILFAQVSGELTRVRHYAVSEMTWSKSLAIAFNGCLAFGLNVVSFSANKKAGALSMTVAANVKQVLTILLAVLIFDLTITQMNMLGIILTLAGGAWYARVEFSEKRRKADMRRLRAI